MRVIKTANTKYPKLKKIVEDYLLKDKVIIIDTDTIAGISVRADSVRAVEKVYQLKQREKGKSLLILVSSISMLKRYCYLNRRQEQVLKQIWQAERPTTVLLTHRNRLAANLTNNEFLAVRLPKNDFLRKMIKSVKVPLVSTSLNLSGEENLSIATLVKSEKPIMQVDLVIENDLSKKLKNRASLLLSLDQNGVIKILRK